MTAFKQILDYESVELGESIAQLDIEEQTLTFSSEVILAGPEALELFQFISEDIVVPEPVAAAA